MSEELSKKLEELKIEDFIWLIYIVIIGLSYISNYFERNYFLFNDIVSKDKYRKITVFIFSVLVVIYFYFFIGSYEDYINLSIFDSDKKRKLSFLSLLSSLLVFISGLIFLYIAYNDDNLDVEIAFN